jgi:hypothetical protein
MAPLSSAARAPVERGFDLWRSMRGRSAGTAIHDRARWAPCDPLSSKHPLS